MKENPMGGRKEAHGLWAWRLDTLNPGASTTISFSLSGLGRGDWGDTDIFFRGNGDIIGATKIDEKLLEELRNREALRAAEEEVRSKDDPVIDGLAERAEDPLQDPASEKIFDMGSLAPDQEVVE